MTQAPTPGPLSGDDVNRECKACGAFKAERDAACTFCGLAPTAPVEASGQDDDLKLIIAHTIIEDLRAQHPGIEQIDNERGDIWLPGGSTPQSSGCIVDIHSVAQSVEQQVLAALRPGHTDLMVSPESIDAFLEANPPPVEASGSEREHGPKCWGGTSFSDEMAHCYCGSTDLRPQPSGETREDVARELWDYQIAARRKKSLSIPKELGSRILALLSARPLALGSQQGVPQKWVEVARYATERGLTVHESNMRMEEFRRVVTPTAVLSVAADEEVK